MAKYLILPQADGNDLSNAVMADAASLPATVSGLTNDTTYDVYLLSAPASVTPSASSGGAPVAIVAYDTAFDLTDLTTYTMDLAVGVGDVIIAIHNSSAVTRTPTSVTVDGVSATLIRSDTMVNGGSKHSWYRITSASARTASISVTLNNAAGRMVISAWTLTGADTSAITSAIGLAPDASVAIDVQAGGVLLALGNSTSSPTYSWTGITERTAHNAFDGTAYYATADLEVAADETGRAVAYTTSFTTNSNLSVLHIPALT